MAGSVKFQEQKVLQTKEANIKKPERVIWQNRILAALLITFAIEAVFVYVKYGELFRSYDFTLGLELFFTFLYFVSLFWIYPKISGIFHSPVFRKLRPVVVNLIEGTVVVVLTTLLTAFMKILPLWIILIIVNAQTDKVKLAFDVDSLRQNIILHAILALFIYYFVERERIKKNLRAQHLKNARIQEEYMEWQLRSLKNQVNPDFLFDSLNALDELVEKDEERSVELVNRLSHLYRQLLEHKDQLVDLSSEMELVKAYNNLLQVRPGKKISFKFDIFGTNGNYKLPPGTLYKLTECFVNNSDEKGDEPLHLKIYTENDRVQISGPLDNFMNIEFIIDQFNKTYELFTEERIITEKRENNLIVALPLLPSAE